MDWLSKPGEDVFDKWLMNIPSPVYHTIGFIIIVFAVFFVMAHFFAWCRDFLLNSKNRGVIKLSAGFTAVIVVGGVCCLAGGPNPNDGGFLLKSEPGAGLIRSIVSISGRDPGHTIHLTEERNGKEDTDNIFEDRVFEPPDA